MNNKWNMMHHALRTANWFCYIWLTIIAGNMAIEAKMNPGIIYGLMSTGIIMAAIYNWIIFGERITAKQCIGIGIVVISVMWMSVAKDEPIVEADTDSIQIANEDLSAMRTSTIAIGLVLSFVSSLRPI
jgi:multidrug transporter EmrE-like cation transporter